MNWHIVEAIDSAKSAPSGPNAVSLFWIISVTTASRWGLASWVNSLHFIVVAPAGAGTPDVVVGVDVFGVVVVVVVVVVVLVVVVVVVIGPPGSVVIATEPPVVFSHAARPTLTTASATGTATAR